MWSFARRATRPSTAAQPQNSVSTLALKSECKPLTDRHLYPTTVEHNHLTDRLHNPAVVSQCPKRAPSQKNPKQASNKQQNPSCLSKQANNLIRYMALTFTALPVYLAAYLPYNCPTPLLF
jgi:hypothetical protein